LGLVNSPKSDRCKQASQTASHILCACVALATLTLILLTWKIWWAPNNANKWQMGFNSAFKGLRFRHLGCHFMQPGDFEDTSVNRMLHFVQGVGLLDAW